MGNLTRDPELRFTPKGTAVANLGMAVNRKWTTESGERKEEVTFLDVSLFGKTAENAAQYLKKGSAAFVEGRLKLDTWDDKATGQKRSKLGVVAETIQFLSGGKRDEAAAERPAPEKPATAPESYPHKPDPDQEIPF